MLNVPPPNPTLVLPDPDHIRAAIDAADERSRLLRRLLLIAIRLDLHLTTGDRIPVRNIKAPKGDGRGE